MIIIKIFFIIDEFKNLFMIKNCYMKFFLLKISVKKIISEELILINKDYLNRGLFCLYIKSKNIENLKNLNIF